MSIILHLFLQFLLKHDCYFFSGILQLKTLHHVLSCTNTVYRHACIFYAWHLCRWNGNWKQCSCNCIMQNHSCFLYCAYHYLYSTSNIKCENPNNSNRSKWATKLSWAEETILKRSYNMNMNRTLSIQPRQDMNTWVVLCWLSLLRRLIKLITGIWLLLSCNPCNILKQFLKSAANEVLCLQFGWKHFDKIPGNSIKSQQNNIY